MSDLIERVAQAMANAVNEGEDWPDWEVEAQAAITATVEAIAQWESDRSKWVNHYVARNFARANGIELKGEKV